MPNPAADIPDHTPASPGSDQRQGAFIAGGEFHGPFVGYQDNSVTYTEEQAYNVAGLPNPYLGLRAFTAADRDIFAGRERMVQALVQRLAAEDGDRLLFLVGASGSGKSSLARAGLMPALEAQLRELGQAVETRILDRPDQALRTTLKHLFHHASLASTLLMDLLNYTPQNGAICIHVPPRPHMQLLLIDQFEEIWSQADANEAQQTLDLLLELTTQLDCPLRIIVTLRSDFLPQLATDTRFESYEGCKVMVRAMSVDELKDAIQKPIQVRYSDKRIEPALVEQLVQDAMTDTTYLPLLQVTLEELWRGGAMRLAAYRGLAEAIQRRAEVVFSYRDHDGLQQEQRSLSEQQAILGMLLDLVRVSPGEEQRETRWRRTRAELAQADSLRERLIVDLTNARLLRTDREAGQNGRSAHIVETVDVVHEALLQDWPRLRETIKAERERLRQREHFLLALQEWQAKGCQDNYLLSGVRLAEAEMLHKQGDSAFQELEALPFYKRCLQRRDRDRHQQVRRARVITAVFGVLALLAALAAVVARTEQRRAERQLRIADSRRLAADSIFLLAQDASEEALLLAIEAAALDSNPTTRQALQQVVTKQRYALTKFTKHRSRVNSVVFSPDGTRLLTASADRTARLWKVDGASLAILQGHLDSVNSAVFSPDGTRLLTASADGTARLWEADGTLLTTLQGHWDSVNSAVFSPDGSRVLTTSDDGTARLWKVDGTSLAILQGHTNRVVSAVFSPDGSRLLTASADRTARVWEADGTPLAILQGHTGRIVSAVFSPDGTHLLTASVDRTARLWKEDGTPLAILQGHTDSINSAVFSPDGTRLLTASADGTARLWEADGTPLATLQDYFRDSMNSAVFSPDGTYLLTASQRGTVSLWDANSTLLRTMSDHTSNIWNAMFSPDGASLLTASADGTARLWDRNGTLLTTLQGHTDNVTSAVFSPDGTRLLTASADGTARLWDRSGTLLTTLQGNTNNVMSAVFSPDGSHLLTTSANKPAHPWDADGTPLITSLYRPDDDNTPLLNPSDDGIVRLWKADGTTLATLQGHTDSVTSAVFSPDGMRVLTASWDNTARLWDHNGSLIATLQGHWDIVWSAIFSPDGTRLLTASDDASARLWDSNGNLLATFGVNGLTGGMTSAVFSSDGRRVLTTSRDNTARLWELDGTLLTTFQGHTDTVYSAVFSPDGMYVLTASADQTARLWEVDGTSLATFQGHVRPVLNAVFSPDGTRVLTASADGTARLWPVELSDWLMAAECESIRTLTESEIRDYRVPTPLHFNDTALYLQRQCPPKYSWER